MNSRVPKTLALLLLSAALTGCASFHRKPVAAVPPPPDAPELSQSPLYSPEMNENSPRLPNLPTTSDVAVVKPPPPPEKPHHIKKPKIAKTVTSPAKSSGSESSNPASAPPSPSVSGSTGATESVQAPPVQTEKKPTVQQASSLPAAPPNDIQAGTNVSTQSPIGELTTGSSADAAETSHHAEDLVKSTREGVESIKRPLSTDEKKTVAELWTFLNRAEQALKNGDVDGAYGLATKARLLLDELTQK